jgi:hypothetical protein
MSGQEQAILSFSISGSMLLGTGVDPIPESAHFRLGPLGGVSNS